MDRNERIRRNTKTLYHQTSPEAASEIVASQRMKRGSPQGLAGSGIYFAVTPEDTGHKAHYKGVILQVRVLLGRVKRISENGDGSITFQSLQREGYDSVEIPRPGGVEYVVYNWDQATKIRVYSTFGDPNSEPLPPHLITGMQQWYAASDAALNRGYLPPPPPMYQDYGGGSCMQCGAPWNGPHYQGCPNGVLCFLMYNSTK